MREWKPIVIGVITSLLILVLTGGGYKAYWVYTNYHILWNWAHRTQGWVNETQPKVEEISQLKITLRKMVGNANIKSMLLQQNRLDKVETRLDKLESQLQTEAENSKPEGKGR